jgi:hypothetical protein
LSRHPALPQPESQPSQQPSDNLAIGNPALSETASNNTSIPESGKNWKDLPDELRLLVLSDLPATQLLTMRLVTSAFKYLIDNDELKLAQATIGIKKWEYEKKVSEFDYSDTSIYSALKHWVQHKRLWFINWMYTTEDFANHYATCYDGDCNAALSVGQYASDLLALHAELHLPKRPSRERGGTKAIYQRARKLQMSSWMTRNGRVHLENDLSRVAQGELGELTVHDYFQLQGMHRNDVYTEGFPTRPLARVTWAYFCQTPIFSTAMEEDFLATFDLKPMNASGGHHYQAPRLAYCIEAGRADDAEVFKLRVAQAIREELRPLQMASILDSVYVW